MAPWVDTLAGWGVVVNIFGGAESVEAAGALFDGPDTASAGKTVAVEGSGSSAPADSTLGIAAGFAATIDGGTGGNGAEGGLLKMDALSVVERLAAGACALGTELRDEVGDFALAFNLGLAEAASPLLLSNSLSTDGIAAGGVFWFASASADRNFPGIGLPLPAVWVGIFTEIWGKLTITVSPQPGSEFARGWPDGSD